MENKEDPGDLKRSEYMQDKEDKEIPDTWVDLLILPAGVLVGAFIKGIIDLVLK